MKTLSIHFCLDCTIDRIPTGISRLKIKLFRPLLFDVKTIRRVWIYFFYKFVLIHSKIFCGIGRIVGSAQTFGIISRISGQEVEQWIFVIKKKFKFSTMSKNIVLKVNTWRKLYFGSRKSIRFPIFPLGVDELWIEKIVVKHLFSRI